MFQVSQFADPNWVSLSIVKFSHNTCPYGSKTYVWSHVANRKDLDFVVRNVSIVDDHGNYQDRILMKISAGVQVLVCQTAHMVSGLQLTHDQETQDLCQLVTYCRQFDPAGGAEHPVEIVVKSPFMAMRYPKTVNTVCIPCYIPSSTDMSEGSSYSGQILLRYGLQESSEPHE